MINEKLTQKLAIAEKYFSKGRFNILVSEACSAFLDGDYERAEHLLEEFPTVENLMEELTSKLKGKSVYRTLKRINESEAINKLDMLKAYFSLGTHAIIEAEKGNIEYLMLATDIWEKLGGMLYGIDCKNLTEISNG